MAFVIGFDVSQSYLRAGKATHTIETDKETISAKLIRSGDRGVLLFVPNEGRLVFLRWDSIRKLIGKQ
jgi:hypothetical protein